MANIFYKKEIYVKYIYFILCVLVFSIIATLYGCKKTQEVVPNESHEEIAVEQVIEEEAGPKWLPVDTRIVIVFGYGYNNPEFVEKAAAALGEEFGLDSENGLIKTLIYPDNFKVGDAERISMLPDLLAEIPVSGLIILGAPERTHISLAKFQDEGRTWPVFSFFSQDDILGTEAGSDFVLDYAPVQTTDTVLVEESVIELSVDLPRLLVSAVNAMQEIKTLPVSVSKLKEIALLVAGSDWKTGSYVDPETGLVSADHFIIEK